MSDFGSLLHELREASAADYWAMVDLSLERAELLTLVVKLYKGLDEYWMEQPENK